MLSGIIVNWDAEVDIGLKQFEHEHSIVGKFVLCETVEREDSINGPIDEFQIDPVRALPH